MLPVEILPVQETIVLRARGSELLILGHHVKKLKDLVKARDFSQYFTTEALVNRPARKLFEAWLRKDHTLWPRLYQTVHKEMELSANGGDGEKRAAKASAQRTSVSAPAARSAALAETVVAGEAKPAAKKAKAAKAEIADEAPKKVKATKEAKPEKTEKKAAKEAKPSKSAGKEKAKKAEKAAPASSKAKGKDAKAKPAAKAKTGAKKKG